MLNPNQFMKHAKVYNKQKKARMTEQDTLNWLLGKYIAYSFNEPRKYPKKPFLDDSVTASANMTDAEMEEMGRKNCYMLGGEVNDS